MTLAQAPSSSAPSALPPSIQELLSSSAPSATTTVQNFPAATDTGAARFFDPGYYLAPSPFDNDFVLGEPLAVLFLLMLLTAFGLLIRAQLPRVKRRDRLKHPAYWLLFFGIVGLVLLYFRRDHVPYLGMRLWLALLLAGFVVWGVMELWRCLRPKR